MAQNPVRDTVPECDQLCKHLGDLLWLADAARRGLIDADMRPALEEVVIQALLGMEQGVNALLADINPAIGLGRYQFEADAAWRATGDEREED